MAEALDVPVECLGGVEEGGALLGGEVEAVAVPVMKSVFGHM